MDHVSLLPVLVEGKWSASRPDRFTPFDRRLGGPRTGLDAVEKRKLLKNGVFWDVTSCGSCINRRFGGT
jgi:hypothetical protein